MHQQEWGSDVPKGYQTGGKFVSELRITAVDKDRDGNVLYKKKKYKKEDFVVAKPDEEEINFNEIDDEELPF